MSKKASCSQCATNDRLFSVLFSKVSLFRAGVVGVLLAAAILCGFLSAQYMNMNEKKLADSRYELVAYRALTKLADRFHVRYIGLVMLAKAVSYYHPDQEEWPNVVVPGFYDTAPELQRMTTLDNIGFLPIVTPEELPSFETFMYDYYDSEPGIPEGAGVHNFGKGVFAIDPSNPNVTYHDTTGEAILYESPNRIIVPNLQLLLSNDTDASRFGFNVHSHPQYGPAIDAMLDECSPRYNYSEAMKHCGWLSDSQPLPVETAENPHPVINNYRSTIIQPVYLNHNTSLLVGFVGGAINWSNLLLQTFQGLEDLDCVMTDSNTSFTYRIQSEKVTFSGTGDLHDRHYESYERSIVLAPDTLSVAGSAPFIVRLYPTRRFLERNRTQSGTFAGVVVAIVFALVAVVFLLNDVLLRRENNRNVKILETKRRFVRFVSHEIRTPLNSVHLGLELLTAELSGMVSLLTDQQDGPLTPVAWTEAEPALPPPCSAETLQILRETLASWQELAADMMGNSESAVDVLNDLLNYDKIEMGTLRLDYSAVSIYPLVEKVAKAFQMQARQKEITLKLSGSLWDADQVAELTIQEQERYRNLVVIGDHGRLAQVMRNLLSNALKFTPADGVIEVNVEWVTGGLPKAPPPIVPEDQRDLLELPRAGSVQVRVTDSGVGLSPEQLSQICSEGMQFNANQLQAGKGSGLGLFISKGLATQHGGVLSVASEGLGKGSSFTVELPVYAKASSPSAALLSLRDATPVSVGKARSRTIRGSVVTESDTQPVTASERTRRLSNLKRILVVDDAESNRKILIRLLKARGYVCQQAEDGQRGIDLYQALQAKGETVDVIVMDFEMPVMDGPTATKKLRELGCTCLIVGVTGNLLPEDVDHFKRQGANAVLGKPLNMKLFDEVLEDQRRPGSGTNLSVDEGEVPGCKAAVTGGDRYAGDVEMV